MSKHARTTITVPADLKARMEAVEEPMNWSAIACAAFEQALADIIKRKGARDMQDVILRLRASQERVGSELKREGEGYGRAWAMNHAEADELTRLEALYDAHERGSWGWDGFFAGTSHQSAATRLAFAILGDEDNRSYSDADEFWDRYADAPASKREQAGELFDDFVRGFVDGALEVWGEVKDKL